MNTDTSLPKRFYGFSYLKKFNPKLLWEICSKGGKKAHALGTAHKWNSAEAQAAGRKGGVISRRGVIPTHYGWYVTFYDAKGRDVATEPCIRKVRPSRYAMRHMPDGGSFDIEGPYELATFKSEQARKTA